MMDKSIPYKDIVMVMESSKVLSAPTPVLPEGFKFRHFSGEEDISLWCRIETAVEEFDTEEDAYKHFNKEFSPHVNELQRRCIFILNKENLPIATAMCWFSNSVMPGRLHWVAVCPEYQGLGLGKAITKKAINTCAELHPGKKMWLSTQTWSYRAVMMYHKLGFCMLKSEVDLGGKISYLQDFDSAVEVLSDVLKPSEVLLLKNTAV